MLFNACNARNTRKLRQKNRRRRCRRLLIQSLQEGGMGWVMLNYAGEYCEYGEYCDDRDA